MIYARWGEQNDVSDGNGRVIPQPRTVIFGRYYLGRLEMNGGRLGCCCCVNNQGFNRLVSVGMCPPFVSQSIVTHVTSVIGDE